MTELDAIVLGDLVRQRRGDQGHDSHRILRHGALLDAACADVVQKQDAHLVTGDQLIAAVRALHGNADTVRVRIRRQHQVSADFLGKGKALLKSSEDLGVRIRAGGKVAVRILLLRNNGDVRDAHVLQDPGDRYQAGAVQRRIDQLQAGVLRETRTDLAGFNGLIQGFLAVFADELDETLVNAFRKAHVLRAGEDIGLLDGIVNDCCGIVRHLAAVRSVSLVAIVLCRVVGRRDHDACVALIITGCKGKCRDRHQLVVDADVDAVCSEDACSVTREIPALQTAVIADSDGLGPALGLDPVSDTLGCLTDDPDVHAVRTCAECAAKTRRTELQSDGEAFLDLVVIPLDVTKLLVQVKINQICRKPALIIILIHVFPPF